MCDMTDRICNIIKKEANIICRTNPKSLFGELYSNALLRIYRYGYMGQKDAYYHKMSRNSMLITLKKELLKGGVLNTYGGDRKSKKFFNMVDPILEYIDSDIEEKPLRFGKKKATAGNSDISELDFSNNDKNTDNWLKGGSL